MDTANSFTHTRALTFISSNPSGWTGWRDLPTNSSAAYCAALRVRILMHQ